MTRRDTITPPVDTRFPYPANAAEMATYFSGKAEATSPLTVKLAIPDYGDVIITLDNGKWSYVGADGSAGDIWADGLDIIRFAEDCGFTPGFMHNVGWQFFLTSDYPGPL